MQTKDVKLGILPFIIATYVVAVVLRPILAAKIISIYSFAFPAGILVFPLSFICNDIFTEVYGYEKSRRIIQAGLVAQVLSCLVIYMAVVIPGASFWHGQEAYSAVLGQNFRLAVASVIACYFGEIANSIVISKLKFRQNGASGMPLYSRFVWSTLAGELVDSILYISLGFFGMYPSDKVFKLVFTTWIGKTTYEVILLPISGWVCQIIKRMEEQDHIDLPEETRYSVI